MENKVIQLPKVQTIQKRMHDRFHEKKASVAVSLASILVLSLFLNQWLVAPNMSRPNSDLRGIASVGLSAEDSKIEYKKNILWEHELAEKIAGGKMAAVHLSEKPSLRDEMLFSTLAGRYGVQFEEGRIIGLNFNSSKANGQAVAILDREKFIKDYRGLWALDFADTKIESKSQTQEIYKLIGADNSEKGRATLDLDLEGHLVGLKIIK